MVILRGLKLIYQSFQFKNMIKVVGFNLDEISIKNLIRTLLRYNGDIWLVKKFATLCFSYKKGNNTIIVVNNTTYNELLEFGGVICKNSITYTRANGRTIIFNFSYIIKLDRVYKIRLLRKGFKF